MSDLLSIILPAWCMAAVLIFLSAPLGCLMLWRNMSFFADTLAHGTLLGVAIAAILHLPLLFGVGITSMLLVGVLWSIHDKRLPMDALLAMTSSVLLCGGLVLINLLPALRPSLARFLFGDILLVSWLDVATVAVLVFLGVLILAFNWRKQLKMSIEVDLAASEGVNVKVQRLVMMLLLAMFTAVALKAIGSLLIGALLMIPAITARLFALSPKQMVVGSFVIAEIGVGVGICSSAALDVASGPCIVLTLGILFLLVYGGNKAFHFLKQNTSR